MKFFADRVTKTSIPIHVVTKRKLKAWLGKQSKSTKAWLKSVEFSADRGEVILVPGSGGSVALVVAGAGKNLDTWSLSPLPGKLPKGRYTLANELDAEAATLAALGWGLGCYRYSEYKSKPRHPSAQLVWPKHCDRAEARRLIAAVTLGRDLVNKPAADLGPAQIASRVRSLAKTHNAKVRIISGQQLQKGFPSIYTVGKAAAKDRQPRLCDLTWGRPKDPKITLVGKGVVFDSGGLDIKSAAGMRLMKKDMGGAASVLALAHLIMDAKLRVRLRVLVPTVEN
ncbi:MAG: leucyl aminopeptidase family protein, partial [Deltaproteobacteria bacterium]|nr:leucyl aminopeptidase family protein [Deltaproteobacteria bacterium]